MTNVGYFKRQAKLFLKDFRTQYFDEEADVFKYNPKFFTDIDGIIVSYDIDEENFSLMNAQHIISLIAGFESWNDLIHATEEKLELGKLLVENRDECANIVDDWNMYLDINSFNDLDDNFKIAIFKEIFL